MRERYYVSTAWDMGHPECEYVVRDTQTQRPEGGHAIVADGLWTGEHGRRRAQVECDRLNADMAGVAA